MRALLTLLLVPATSAALAAEPPVAPVVPNPAGATVKAMTDSVPSSRHGTSAHHRRILVAGGGRRGVGGDPSARVAEATAAARVQPSGAGYLGGMQVYPFSEGALYQVYTAPGEVTDIALEPGETLEGTGPVAAGDTVRWIIGDTESGAGDTRRMHVLVKPTRGDLTTNLVINTDRRTYHLELRATARTYMASVSFAFPKDALIAVSRSGADVTKSEAAAATAAASHPPSSLPGSLDIDALAFRYRITGGKPPWRPLRAFDDGRQVYIQFPPGIAQGEMPPLWVIGPSGSELVNYRVQGAHMIVDRLFTAAELRLGGKHQAKVRIVRTDKAAS